MLRQRRGHSALWVGVFIAFFDKLSSRLYRELSLLLLTAAGVAKCSANHLKNSLRLSRSLLRKGTVRKCS
jgi:hypothetical protein